MVRNLLSLLAQGVGLLYTEEEWAAAAAKGKTDIENFITAIKREFERRPWYAAGYALCLIATAVIPISKVTAAIKALKPLLRALDRAGGADDIAEIMARRGEILPEHLGGDAPDPALPKPDTHEPAPDVTPDVTPDPAPDATLDPIPDRPEVRDDPEPVRTEDPQERDTPDETPATTRIRGKDYRRRPRAGTVERLTEDDAAKRLNDAGYDTYNITNGSGHGTDIVGVKRGPPPEVRVIEVKSGGARPSATQAKGGADHTQSVLDRLNGNNNTNLDDGGLRDVLEQYGFDRDRWASDPNVQYELWRYPDADLATNTSGTPVGMDWTKGGYAGRDFFSIDAKTGGFDRSDPFKYRNRP